MKIMIKHILWFLLVLYAFTILHEMCHYIIFLINHIPVKEIAIFPIKINFTEHHVTVRLHYSIVYLGYIIPRLPKLCEEEYLSFAKIISKVLIAPVIFHGIIFIGSLFFSMFYIFRVMAFVNVVMLLSTCQKSANTYGDFKAFLTMKKKQDFAAKIMLSYIYNDENELQNKIFLQNKLA